MNSSLYTALGGNVYVSRYHGNDSQTCGTSEQTSCKSIAAGVARAQWGDTVNVDGTQTEHDAYPCTPSLTSSSREVFIDKSVSLKASTSVVYIRCKNGGMFFIGGKKKLEVSVEGFLFINSSVNGENCSRFALNNCSFVNASHSVALNLKSDGELQVMKLSLRNSKCINSSTSCVHITGNRLSVEVYNSVFWGNVASGQNQGIFTITASQHDNTTVVEPQFNVTVTNSSFKGNYSPYKGSLYINFGVKKDVTRCKSNRGKSAELFRLLLKRSARASVLFIERTYFTNNVGRGLEVGFGSEVDLSLRSCVFHRNTLGMVTSTIGGAALAINSMLTVRLNISNSTFTENNSTLASGGAIGVVNSMDVFVNVRSCLFHKNTAWTDGSAILIGHPLSLEPDGAVKHAVVRIEDVEFRRNILESNPYSNFIRGGAVLFEVSGSLDVVIYNTSFVENFSVRGSLTLYMVSGYDLNILVSDTNFSKNGPIRRFANFTDNHTPGFVVFSGSGLLNLTLTRVVMSDHVLEYGPFSEFCDVFGQTVEIKITSLIFKDNSNGTININTQAGESINTSSNIQVHNSSFTDNINFAFLLQLASSTSTNVRFQNVIFSGNRNLGSPSPLLEMEGKSTANMINMQNVAFTNNFILAPVVRIVFDRADQYTPCFQDWIYQSNVYFDAVFLKDNYVPSSSLVELCNGRHIMVSCAFVNNFVSPMFSNLFIERGSTSVSLTNTSFLQTVEPRKIRGFKFGRNTLFHSDTPAPVSFRNVTFKWGISGAIDVLLMVTESFQVSIDDASTIECPLGSTLKDSNYSYFYFFTAKDCEIPKLLLTSFVYSCARCESNMYSILPMAKQCLPCPPGANCSFDNIGARPDFWGYPVTSNPGHVEFARCPVGYCCPHKNFSCPYQNDTYMSSGCQGNREGILCGRCRNGYTETLFSPECRSVHHCHDGYWFWPVAFLISLAFAVYLVQKPSIWSMVMKKVLWFKQESQVLENTSDTSKGGGYIKIVFYFYQMANLLMIDDSPISLLKSYVLGPVIGLFNFEIFNSHKGLICPVVGLTVLNKTMLHFCQVPAVLVCILLVYLAHAVVNKTKKRNPVFASADRYLGALVETLLLGYSTLANTTMKMLDCVEIESSYRFFYDGNIGCGLENWWQSLCVLLVVGLVIPFALVLLFGTKLMVKGSVSSVNFLFACILPLPFLVYWLICRDRIRKKVSCDLRESNNPGSNGTLAPPVNRSCVLNVLVGPFREPSREEGSGTIYWEGVLIFRRLSLIVLRIFINDPLRRMMYMTVACSIILVHHVWAKPFKDSKVNVVETLSLTALVIIAVNNLGQAAGGFNESFFQWTEIALLGVTPLLFLFFAALTLVSQVGYYLFVSGKFILCCVRIIIQKCQEEVQLTRPLLK